MNVQILESFDSACDAFVRARPGATLCHTFAWTTMIMRTFRHRAYYLVARDAGRPSGVLPLNHVRSRLFGSHLVSGAFGNYGGPLVEDPTALDALYHRAVALAAKLRCDTIEFRNVEPLPYDLHLRSDKVCLGLPLVADPDELWNGFRKDTKVRKQVRKAEDAGVTARCGGLELLDDFYDLYALRMHQLGTPCYSRGLMASILDTFPDDSRVWVAYLNGQTAAAKLVVQFNGWVESCWGVTREECRDACPNHLLYWAAMKHYCHAGARYFDFGRSTIDTEPYFFKKRWGTRQIDLHYQYWVRPGYAFSVISPDNPKYKKRIEMWKKLPHWLTRIIGPAISRGLP